jgi:hypothetical protein
MGFSDGHFGQRPDHWLSAIARLSVLTAPLAALRRCMRQQLARSASARSICSASAPSGTLRSSGGTSEFSMIQLHGGPCRLRLGPTPALAASNGDRASPSRSRRNCQQTRSAAARPLRGRLPSAPTLSSASSTTPSWRHRRTASEDVHPRTCHRRTGASTFSLILQVLPLFVSARLSRSGSRRGRLRPVRHFGASNSERHRVLCHIE